MSEVIADLIGGNSEMDQAIEAEPGSRSEPVPARSAERVKKEREAAEKRETAGPANAVDYPPGSFAASTADDTPEQARAAPAAEEEMSPAEDRGKEAPPSAAADYPPSSTADDATPPDTPTPDEASPKDELPKTATPSEEQHPSSWWADTALKCLGKRRGDWELAPFKAMVCEVDHAYIPLKRVKASYCASCKKEHTDIGADVFINLRRGAEAEALLICDGSPKQDGQADGEVLQVQIDADGKAKKEDEEDVEIDAAGDEAAVADCDVDEALEGYVEACGKRPFTPKDIGTILQGIPRVIDGIVNLNAIVGAKNKASRCVEAGADGVVFTIVEAWLRCVGLNDFADNKLKKIWDLPRHGKVQSLEAQAFKVDAAKARKLIREINQRARRTREAKAKAKGVAAPQKALFLPGGVEELCRTFADTIRPYAMSATGTGMKMLIYKKEKALWEKGTYADLAPLFRKTLEESGKYTEVSDKGERIVHTLFQTDSAKIDLTNMVAVAHLCKAAAPFLVDLERWSMMDVQSGDDEWPLLPVKGCQVVDLRTGATRQRTEKDLFTRECPVVYDPSASTKPMEQFALQLMCDRTHLAKFLQLISGYFALGKNPEQRFCIFAGSENGSNGKSTFVKILKFVLGAFLVEPNEKFLKDDKFASKSAADPFLIECRGARLIAIPETPEINEQILKRFVTDPMKARDLYEGAQEIPPTYKTLMHVNAVPKITDLASYRRLICILFIARFLSVEEQARAAIEEELARAMVAEEVNSTADHPSHCSKIYPLVTDFEKRFSSPQGAAGALNWIVEGAKEYFKQKAAGVSFDGMMPEEVKMAKQEMQEDSDAITRFLKAETKPRRAGAKLLKRSITLTKPLLSCSCFPT